MKSPQHRIFVCTKQRSANDPKGCCCNADALEIYQAFQDEIQKRQLGDRVEVRRSGCLDQCESGAIALVYQPSRNEFSWLPTKLRLKLRRLFIPKRFLYGHLTCTDVPEIVDSHFIQGQALQRCQISTNS
ncbi:(2Fe-2S) ferredoxin domain-containing protein [Phormidesmis sp. 146-12]